MAVDNIPGLPHEDNLRTPVSTKQFRDKYDQIDWSVKTPKAIDISQPLNKEHLSNG